ncbi:hypothetical protein C8J55DRAFT_514374 [Lentinula edodes]|uniref:DUF4203 domain-containing protein n=1 Tax=Lentinula lateritia TaxID=40482 RepID=A0A9W9ADU8_9AGAR|nr:hypothetical protein C8J55DRAFT_514374 [Lentinula edodes]
MATNTSSLSNSSDSLSTLLPSSSYLLAYTLPLLLVSLILTFSGAFLTLDRTRRFRAKNDMYVMPGSLGKETKGLRLKRMMVLEGGVGGILLGYAFGVHLSTFLALIIPNNTSSSLSSGAFIAIWVLSALTTTILAARYSVAALGLAGLSGGALSALGVCIIIHPPLEARVVFTIGVMVVSVIAIMLSAFIPPLTRFKHPLLRLAASSTGSFGVTMCISLLSSSSFSSSSASSLQSWSSPWSHLYLSASSSWGTSTEKGFSALFCILILAGTVCDWAFWRKWGECPDEKWDSYLAEYAVNLPNDMKRAGSFRPFESVWERVFGSGDNRNEKARALKEGKIEKEVAFPIDDADLGLDLDAGYLSSPGPGKLRKFDSTSPFINSVDEPLPLYKPHPGLLLKNGRRSSSSRSLSSPSPGFRKKEIVKFRPLDELSSSDEDELDHEKERARIRAVRRRTDPKIRSTSPDPSDTDNALFGPPDYSDFEENGDKDRTVGEEDIVSGVTRSMSSTPQWTPRFLKQHRSSLSSAHSSAHSSPSQTSRSSERTAVASSNSHPIPPVLAEALPSLSTPTTKALPVTQPLVQPLTSSVTPPLVLPVPATPSLLNALHRVEKARNEAYSREMVGNGSGGAGRDPVIMREEGRGQRWGEFWQEVKEVKVKGGNGGEGRR